LACFEFVENLLEMATQEFDLLVEGTKSNQSSVVETFSYLKVITDV
jgi:hypothetical protein